MSGASNPRLFPVSLCGLLMIALLAVNSHAATEVSASQVAEMRSADGAVVLVDLMPRIFFDNEHIPGAVNIPMNEFDSTIETAIPDKGAKVILYCMGRQ